MSSPATQIAAVIPASGGKDVSDVKISCTHPVPVPGLGEVLVKLDFSGVCHSDVHSIRGDTPMKTDVAGHEGVGKVVAEDINSDFSVGSDLDESQWMGQAVGIRYVWHVRFRNLPPVGLEFLLMSPLQCFRWLYSSCRECEICEVNHTACPNQRNAEYIVTPAIHATKIPSGLSPDSAAPLLCAGIAMYSSIKKVRARQGNWLAILGAGGALKKPKLKDHADRFKGRKKRELCLSLGATEFLDFRKVDIVEAAKMITSGLGVHGVICTANGEAAYQQSMQMLRPLGTLVCVGIPHVPFRVPVTPFEMIVKGLTIVGNSAGTAEEMDELLAMAVNGDVKAHIEVFDLEEIVDVLQKLERSEIEGRAVLRIP
ncbi:hypothetical protein N7454_007869 [Penicillium verhagenii]|nr:hypothetical protein N7454_007869 [Penicillium verhagenii]